MPRRPPAPIHRSPATSRRWRRVTLLLTGVAALLGGAPRARAQVVPTQLGHLVVPGGRVTLDFTPSFTTWSERYGPHTVNGAVVDGAEELGADLENPENIFPGVAALQQRIRELSGDAGYSVTMGSTVGRVTRDVKRIDSGLRIGVFDWFTIGVDVPYVKTRAAVDVGYIPSAGVNVGVNPTEADPDAVSTLLAQLQAASTAATERAASLCAAGDASCGSAQELADRVGTFTTRTRQAYLSSPVFPTAGSTVATALDDALTSLDGDLAAAGLTGIAAPMAYAPATLDAEGFAGLPDDGSVAGAPLATTDGIWTLGDVEVSAALRLLDGEVRDSGAVSPRLAWYLAGGALVRLGTGTPDDPSNPFDIGSGDGQMDIEGRVEAALRVGAHLALHAAGRYGVQQEGTLTRRVAPHEQVYPPLSTLRTVRWTPGDYFFVELSPRFHLGEALALSVDLRHYHKAADSYVVVPEAADATDPVDAADLDRETEVTLQEIAFGVRYSTLATWRRGQTGTPVEVGARLVRALDGLGGQTPRDTRVEFTVSLFKRLWGRH